MTEQAEFNFNNKAKPGKRFKPLGHCLSCGEPIPPDRDFCDNGICKNEFYRESEMEEEKEEVLAEQEELKREERKSDALKGVEE